MADKTITQLPVASAIGTTDVSVLVSNNVDYQFDFALLLQFISSNISTGASITFGTVVPQNNAGNNGDVFFKTDTPSFYQKTNGAWIQTYSQAAATVTGNALLYGQGVPGSTIGNDNDSYINTVTGIFYLRTAGTWNQVFSMATGPQGPQGTAGVNGTNGANGNTLLSGTTDPVNTIGNNGDYYINLSTYGFFGPKSAGAWGSAVSLIGATGETGPAGPAGSVGANGAQGTPGATGANGAGVAAGGTAGQVLAKIDATDYNTEWINPSETGVPADTQATANTLMLRDINSNVRIGAIIFKDYDSGSDGFYIRSTLSAFIIAKIGGSDLFYMNSDGSIQRMSDSKKVLFQGDAGSLPSGGAANQILAKIDATDNNVQWVTPGSTTVEDTNATPNTLMLRDANGNVRIGDIIFRDYDSNSDGFYIRSSLTQFIISKIGGADLFTMNTDGSIKRLSDNKNVLFQGDIVVPAQPSLSSSTGETWAALGDSFTNRNIYQSFILTKTGITINNFATDGSCIASGFDTAVGDGITRPSFCETLSNALASNPEGLIVVTGGNDWDLGVPIGSISDTTQTTYYGAIKYIITTCQALSTPIKLRFVTMTQRNSTTNSGTVTGRSNYSSQLAYVNAMLDVCGQYSIPVLNAFNKAGITYENSSVYTSDSVHPDTTAGKALYGNFIGDNIISGIN